MNINYVASLSGGKDSTAMVLRLIEENFPLTHVVFYDAGMEYNAIYHVIYDMMKPKIESYGAELITLKPENSFLYDMLIRPVNHRNGSVSYGYEWCGGLCRWQTTMKTMTINKFINSLNGAYVQYIGIASDEPKRVKTELNKLYPLVDWKMTEQDCLEYCYDKGIQWLEKDRNGHDIDLYQILQRVSCYCCGNKNLKELKAMYEFLPEYWERMKGLQTRIPDRPFRSKSKETIFDLELRFEKERSANAK